MPWVTIRTGIVAADGRETVLTEYQCDWPGCAHAAEHVVAAVRAVGMSHALCPEHNATMRSRTQSAEENTDEPNHD